MRGKGYIFFLLFFLSFTSWSAAATHSQKQAPKGSLKGRVLDADTKIPLIGVNVFLAGLNVGDATDEAGWYFMENVPVGAYTIKFSYIGYEALARADVVVRSKRTTFLDAELKMSPLELESVVVSGGYFSAVEDQPVSAVNFSYEEIRRAPGSAGDVSRIIMGLPSIAKVDDQSNNLVVRGGNPIENTHFIDNIEIANINHFPSQGASGGPIGMLNVDLIQDVSFYAGGFSVAYGDKLSSVMDLTFREGNRDRINGELDLSFAGFGGVAEGPISDGKGSWLFSVRRSYLDLLLKMVDVGATVAPRFGDFQGKLVYDINDRHKLIALGVWGNDKMKSDQSQAVENDMVVFGEQDITQSTAGINWRALWAGSGYSNTSLSYSSNDYDEDFYETGTGNQLTQNRSREQSFNLRNVNHFRLNHNNSIDFGVETKYLVADYDNLYAEYTDAFGQPVSSLVIDNRVTSNKLGIFLNYTLKPTSRLTAPAGLRGDYFSGNSNGHISPRLSMSYRLSDRTTLNGATGIFYQSLPILFLASSDRNRDLKDPVATHFIAGIEHLLSDDTRLSVEVYQKNYRDFPIDPEQPGLFLLDEIYYRDAFVFNYDKLVDTGKASSGGVEIMVQKKLAQDFYGLASASYFRTRYKGQDGIWRNRNFDNRFIFSVEGGYKPNAKWEFSVRWIYAGGRPFTPFNLEASQAINRSVLDENNINGERYPAYHSLNVRFDRRFHFSGSNLVFYSSVWNVYNRENVASYYWNQIENRPDRITQWSLLPIFGLEYEF